MFMTLAIHPLQCRFQRNTSQLKGYHGNLLGYLVVLYKLFDRFLMSALCCPIVSNVIPNTSVQCKSQIYLKVHHHS